MIVNLWKSFMWTEIEETNMDAIVTVMSTTLVVVKVRPERNAVNCDWRNIYDFHIFTVIYSPLRGFIWNQHNDQLPVGLLAQLVGRCTSIALVLGPNLVQAWIFFRSYFHYHWSSVHNCKEGFHPCVKCSILGRFILLVYNISKQIPCCCVSVQKLIKVISYTHTAQPSVLLNMFLPKFDVFCDLLLDTPMATMNPFVFCNKEQKTVNADVVCPLIEHKN